MHLDEHIRRLMEIRKRVAKEMGLTLSGMNGQEQVAVATYVQTIIIEETGESIRKAIDRGNPI